MNIECKRCNRKFPPDLLNRMTSFTPETGLRYETMCPLCALTERNKAAGLPPDEPFSGEMAHDMWLRAKAYAETHP